MSIQRYTVIGDGWETEFPCDDGEYVKYSDHVKHIEELEQQLSFEKRQKAKAREQRDEQTQLAKKYKDQLSVLLNKK